MVPECVQYTHIEMHDVGVDLNKLIHILYTCRQTEHLLDVTMERSVYKAALNKAKSSIVTPFSSSGQLSPPPPGARRPPNSTPIEAHYSFDMAQQVFYMNDPLQPGPVYILMPRKNAIFGICCGAIPCQINYDRVSRLYK